MKIKEVPYEVVMAMSTLVEVCNDHPNCNDCPFCDGKNCYLQDVPSKWGFRVITKKVGEIGGEDY